MQLPLSSNIFIFLLGSRAASIERDVLRREFLSEKGFAEGKIRRQNGAAISEEKELLSLRSRLQHRFLAAHALHNTYSVDSLLICLHVSGCEKHNGNPGTRWLQMFASGTRREWLEIRSVGIEFSESYKTRIRRIY